MFQMSRHRTKKYGFTIVEMLIVVAIIAILAAILLPVINKAYAKAKSATVKKALIDFETAVDAYRQEYGRLPIPGGKDSGDKAYDSSTQDGKNILLALQGDDGVSNIPNPKKINFFASDLVETNGVFQDPWGNEILMLFDANFDNEILDAVSDRGDLKRNSAAISLGPDGKSGTDEQKGDDIVSFKSAQAN